MILGGLVPFSLNDFPGNISAVVFTQGCNFRCPFCHNGSLLTSQPDPDYSLTELEFFDFLKEKQGKLDGIVISGGEPTLHADLPAFIRTIKMMGFKIKLDTNGSRPGMLKTLIDETLLDYIAMDIKAPIHRYDHLTGVSPEKKNIIESLYLISGSGIRHQFRSTVVPSLLSEEDLSMIRSMIPSGSRYTIQSFDPKNALDPALRQQYPAAIPFEYLPETAMAV